MTVWAQRTFAKGEWAPVQDLFEKHFMALRGPKEMMMVIANDEWNKDQLFVALPDKALLRMYEGFEEIGTGELPKVATLLVGLVTSFEARFKYKRDKPELA